MKLKNKVKQTAKPISLIENIANGSIVINSIEVMRDIIRKFPTEPYLVRIHADLLLKHGMAVEAAKAYNRAAGLFHENGEVLPAIVSKMSNWHIEMPSDQDIKFFFSDVNSYNEKELPINIFFSRLSVDELKALCFLFEIIREPAGQTIKKIGDVADNLFFVVSGKLKDSIYLTLQNPGKFFRNPAVILSGNDYFGDIYPFDKEQRSQSHIETLEPTELVAISKEKLIQICRKYPNIELAIIDLLKIRSQSETGEPSTQLRKVLRQELKLKLSLEIIPKKSDGQTIALEGLSKDISVGGMGIILDSNQFKNRVDFHFFRSSLKNSKIRVVIAKEGNSLSVSGKVVWIREIVHEGSKTMAMGMQFSDMSPREKGLLYTLINSL